MKSAVFLVLLSLSLMLSISCKKEYSLENVHIIYTSNGSLQSLSGDCMPSSVYGLLKVGEAADSSNYIDVQINVTKIGTYQVISNLVNGIRFNALGEFLAPGTHLVRMSASGTPQATGPFPYTISYDQGSCIIIV